MAVFLGFPARIETKFTILFQLTQQEHKVSNLEVDKKGLKRQVDALELDNNKLKEEVG